MGHSVSAIKWWLSVVILFLNFLMNRKDRNRVQLICISRRKLSQFGNGIWINIHRQMNYSAPKGQLQRNHPRSRIELQRGWIWLWRENIPISNSTMKKWSRCIRKGTAAERLEKSLDLQKTRSKNVWGGQDAKPGKSRKVYQNDAGDQQGKHQPHCQR